MRDHSKAGCVPPPAAPATVSVPFSTLGFAPAVATAAVRDVWSHTELEDATGATFKATVAPVDSVFVLLSPK